jgi:hypothetical protein
VTITLKSYSIDVDRSTVRFTVDGKVIAEGKGEKSALFTTGPIGKLMKIRTQVTTADGVNYEETFSINPAEVDLVYESSSYAHPLYKGKRLLPPTSPVSITAIPHMKTTGGSKVDPRSLVYTWKDGTKVLASASGTGKRRLSLTGPQVYRNKQISVEVSTQDASTQAARTITLAPNASRPLVYHFDPILGLLTQQAMQGTVEIRDQEITLINIPYFFSISTRNNPSHATTWRINGEKSPSANGDANALTLRPNGEGVARITLQMQGTEAFLEQGQTTFDLKYNMQTNSPAL